MWIDTLSIAQCNVCVCVCMCDICMGVYVYLPLPSKQIKAFTVLNPIPCSYDQTIILKY